MTFSLFSGLPGPGLAESLENAAEIEILDKGGGEEDYRDGYYQRDEHYGIHFFYPRFLFPL